MNRIVLMADELIAQTHPDNWGLVARLSRELFSLVGNPDFIHNVVVPQDHIGALSKQLRGDKFSVVIDMTGGWMSESLRSLFSFTPVIKDFHLSRVRDVSDPSLHTTGHIVHMPKTLRVARGATFNFSCPLILDDVSFSGLSSEVATRMFSLIPKQTTHAFLIANDGDLGPKPGARRRLEASGSRVLAGHTMNTSEGEDGWHIKDFVSHPNLERMIGASLMIQELFEQDGRDSSLVRRLFSNESMRRIFFPNAMTVDDLAVLREQDAFIPNKEHIPDRDSIHMTNPTLLISPYVLEHISSKRFRAHFDQATQLMLDLRRLSIESETRMEAVRGLRDVVRRSIEGVPVGPERSRL